MNQKDHEQKNETFSKKKVNIDLYVVFKKITHKLKSDIQFDQYSFYFILALIKK